MKNWWRTAKKKEQQIWKKMAMKLKQGSDGGTTEGVQRRFFSYVKKKIKKIKIKKSRNGRWCDSEDSNSEGFKGHFSPGLCSLHGCVLHTVLYKGFRWAYTFITSTPFFSLIKYSKQMTRNCRKYSSFFFFDPCCPDWEQQGSHFSLLASWIACFFLAKGIFSSHRAPPLTASTFALNTWKKQGGFYQLKQPPDTFVWHRRFWWLRSHFSKHTSNLTPLP